MRVVVFLRPQRFNAQVLEYGLEDPLLEVATLDDGRFPSKAWGPSL
jgi:hypothetical protein